MVELKNNVIDKHNFFIISLNSTIFFILSYLFLHIISQLITVLSASNFNIDTILYYNKIDFIIGKTAWNFNSVKIIFSSGPFLSLIFAFLFLIVYSKVIEYDGFLKLFFLWGFAQAFTMFFGSLLIGSFLYKGFGYVFTWMYFSDTAKLVVSLSSIFALVLIGSLSTKYFLLSANIYFNFQKSYNRKLFVLSQIFVPYIAGNLILFLLKIPGNNYYDTFVLMSMILIIIPIFLRYKDFPDFFFDEEHKTINIAWRYLILMIIVLLLIRIGLNNGIRL